MDVGAALGSKWRAVAAKRRYARFVSPTTHSRTNPDGHQLPAWVWCPSLLYEDRKVGSTVSTNKQAHAFVTSDNRTAYVLFEEHYEKNCYPHRPHWSCVSLGYLDDVLKDLFRSASSCEGGMLQHRGGWVLPETYLQRWLETLAEPLAMPDVRGPLAYGTAFHANLPMEMRDAIETSMHERGLSAEVATLNGREVSLYQDFDLLNAIYGRGPVGAWRFIGSWPGNHGSRRKELGYTASLLSSYPPTLPPAMYRCETEHVIVKSARGDWENAGWTYSVVADYIRGYAEQERASPGSFRTAFKHFRQAVASAPQIADETRIELSFDNMAAGYSRDEAEKLVNLFSADAQSAQVTLAQVRAKNKDCPDSHVLYRLLNCQGARWLPAECQRLEATQMEAF